jgi:hypothetical protein
LRTLRISPESPRHWWRRRDSCSNPSGMAWTMPSSDAAHASPDAERVIRAFYPDPGAGSRALQRISQSMSLYRAKQVGLASPLGVASQPCRLRQGPPNEPRFHFALTSEGDHCVSANRTRVRKSYISGSTYVAVSLGSHLTLPEQQGRRLAS